MEQEIITTILIKCTASHFFDLDELIAIQGNLKELSEINYNKLRNNILKNGFISPIHVWENKVKNQFEILDGTQRLRTCQKLKEEGFIIPKLPVTIITADNEKQAREILLSLVSQYGELNEQGLYEFIETSGIEIETLRNELVVDFGKIDMELFEKNYYSDIATDELRPDDLENDEEFKVNKDSFFSIIRDEVLRILNESEEIGHESQLKIEQYIISLIKNLNWKDINECRNS